MKESDRTFRVLTLNCWGLKYVSKHREARMQEIGRRLAHEESNNDIVCLQEVWVESDFNYIAECVSHLLPYAKFYYSGMLSGPGLAVLSKWPIVDASINSFTLNGRPSAFFRGDWYVGKSVVSAVIDHPHGRIHVLNAHLHAPYGKGDAAYTCHRTAQAWDMARIAQRAVQGECVLAMGDLNSVPGSLTYRLLDSIGSLSDSWVDSKGENTEDIGSMPPYDQIRRAGTTCDSRLNSWRETRRPDEAKRLDYIFYDKSRATVQDIEVAFIEPLEGIGSLSDHFAVRATYEMRDSRVIRAAPTVSELLDMYDGMLQLIEDYWPTARWQRTWRLAHFWTSIVVVVAAHIAVFWGALDSRSYVGFILMLVSTLVAVTGILDGLIGFLFGRHETRALREFESEIRLAKRYANERAQSKE
uniref:ARAD1C34628p n=1 Tax=Blastobotrys adeninivorans TaxID=409370 RepID=A0A060T926_BLAAD